MSAESWSLNGRTTEILSPTPAEGKELDSLARHILPIAVADSVHPSASRLAHLYGLPKTHKGQLAMRPILSGMQTIAKWLDDKLKHLAINEYTVTDTFEFLNEVREFAINKGHILASYDVSSLFTNVPLEETIHLTLP